jgi:hypothetical protein
VSGARSWRIMEIGIRLSAHMVAANFP